MKLYSQDTCSKDLACQGFDYQSFSGLQPPVCRYKRQIDRFVAQNAVSGVCNMRFHLEISRLSLLLAFYTRTTLVAEIGTSCYIYERRAFCSSLWSSRSRCCFCFKCFVYSKQLLQKRIAQPQLPQLLTQ